MFVHGDGVTERSATVRNHLSGRGESARIVMGHEHPAISLKVSAVSAVKCPCFLASERVIVLPAFSQWAAGSKIGSGQFMSALANDTKFEQAIAVVSGKLLPIKLAADF